MRGGKPVLLPNWWSPPGPESESAPGPESESAPGPASESEAGSGLQCVYLSLRKFLGFRCRRVAGLTLRRCSRLSWARRWALVRCLEHHPGSDQPGHVEQPACRTRCPKEPHAQRSWHLQRSPPAQSEDLPPEVWLTESLRRRAAPPRRTIARAPRHVQADRFPDGVPGAGREPSVVCS